MAGSDVLIIGAGPTGLMAACQLALRNIPFRIIDKNKGPTVESRALAIHAASMEAFSQMGIAEQFLQLGKRTKAINFLVKGKVGEHIKLSEFGKGLTAFPFVLMLEQSKTERLLTDFIERRGHKIEWETELMSISQDDNLVWATISQSEASEETIEASWLIGADGAKSMVRQQLKIPFGGQTYPVNLFVLDCKVNWPLQNDEMYIAFSDHSFAAFFPLPEERCRVIGFVPEDVGEKENISFEDVNNGFAERMQMKIELLDPNWISMYHAHHRYVSQFRIGRCFLAGDAAHIHSPVGAQGMNTGLQDACNISWKLALVIKKQAEVILLDTYEQERLPFARRLVRTTDRAFGIAVSKNLFTKTMRMYVVPKILAVILKVNFVAHYIFRNISQIGISYYETLLAQNASKGSFPSVAPKPGERIPYAEYKDTAGRTLNIQQHLNDLMLHLFLFTGETDKSPVSLIKEVVKKFEEIITIDFIPLTAETINVYKSFGIKTTGFYLVRPDFHIAYRSAEPDANHFEAFIASFLKNI